MKLIYKDGLSKTIGEMMQERVWGLSPGPHSRWDGASGYNRAIALGPIGAGV